MTAISESETITSCTPVGRPMRTSLVRIGHCNRKLRTITISKSSGLLRTPRYTNMQARAISVAPICPTAAELIPCGGSPNQPWINAGVNNALQTDTTISA